MKINVSKEWLIQAGKAEDKYNLPGVLACGGIMKDMKLSKIYIECECFSKNHMVVFEYDPEYNQISIHYQLNNYLGFWKRLYHGTRFIFGFDKDFYGHWSETLIGSKDRDELIGFLKQLN